MMLSTTRNNLLLRAKGAGKIAVSLLFWCALWGVLAVLLGKPVLLPTPWAVVRRLGSLAVTAEYWKSVAFSFLRIFTGYVLGCACGILLAFLCARFGAVRVLFQPFLSVVRSVPVSSFIILALVWIGRENVPIFIAFLMVLPIVVGNLCEGFGQIDIQLAEVAKVYRFGVWKTFRYVTLPALLPFFVSAAQTSLGLAWKAGVAAEVLCSLSASIGGQIYASKLYLDTESLFAWTVTVILISMLIEKLIFAKKKKEGKRP